MKSIIASITALFSSSKSQELQFPPNIEMNEKVISALIESGSNTNKLHPLEHHFYCHSSDDLRLLMSKGEALGYKVANIGDNIYEDTHWWYGDLIKETRLNIDTINKENSTMLKLANDFSADYDGWGTPVVE